MPTDSGLAASAASPRRSSTVAWIIAVLLALIAGSLLTQRPAPWGVAGPAFGQTPMAGAKGIFAFTAPLDKNKHGLFMMDADAGNIWCYEYVGATRKLRLVAARSYLYDRYLEDYMNEEPLPEQVRLMLERQRQAKQRIGGGLGAADGNGPGMNPGTAPTATGAGRPDADDGIKNDAP